MSGWAYGWIMGDVLVDEWMDGQKSILQMVHIKMTGWMDESMDRWKNGWAYGWMMDDILIDEWMDGQMDGWIEEHIIDGG